MSMHEDHSHDHEHETGHGPGHNHAHSHDHMHSHVHVDPKRERQEQLATLASSFIEGFRKADNKPAFLELADVPASRTGADGLKMHLIDVAIETRWQLGTASPAFGSRELAYLPYPSGMVADRETMTFTYVSLTERADVDLFEILDQRSRQSSA